MSFSELGSFSKESAIDAVAEAAFEALAGRGRCIPNPHTPENMFLPRLFSACLTGTRR